MAPNQAAWTGNRANAVVDVCGTLVRDDTTLGLIAWHLARRGRRTAASVVRAVTQRRSPIRWAVMILERLTDTHFFKQIAVRALKGESTIALQASAGEYADFLMTRRRLPETEALLRDSSSDRQLILASSSLEPIVAELAHRLNAEYVASTLESVHGILTGRYERDLSGQKVGAIAEKFGPEAVANIDLCITDNLSDSALLECSRGRHVVLHSRRHRARWNISAVTFITVGD